MIRLTLALMIVLAAACGDDGPDGTAFLWDPGAGEMHAFPDDSFTVDDPTSRTGLRLDATPERIPLLQTFPETFQDIFREMQTLDGFGVTAGAVVQFGGPIDVSQLPTGPETADVSSPIVMLVRDDTGLTPWPYELQVTDENYTVILHPMKPLPARSEIVIVVTNRVIDVDGSPVVPSKAMAAALDSRGIDDVTDRIAPRIAAAANDAIAIGVAATIKDLAGVVVYTTQSIHEDAVAIAEHVDGRSITANSGIVCTDEAVWTRCEGSFEAIDYRGDDGVIQDILGPIDLDITISYQVPFTVWLPLSRPGPYGGDAFPILIYGHGLGGGRDQGERLAEFAAPRGMATIAIDALRHGEHPTSDSRSVLGRTLDFFGISANDLTFEPILMRDHFRQSTYDKLQLVRMLALGLDLDGDAQPDLDPSRMSYLGVSLGGIMAPEFLALSPDIGAAVLVVPGGRVSSIVSDAEQFSLVIDFMKPADATDGDVDRFFPTLQLVLDRGDAAAWAPHLLAQGDTLPPGMPAAAPHLLMGMVIDDDTVPNSSNRALARALGIPAVPPIIQPIGLIETTGPAPVTANLADGRTAGLLQFDRIADGASATKPATHSNIGDSEVGAEAWFEFLDSHLTSEAPVIIDPYAALGL